MELKKGQDKISEERTLFDTLGDELRRERQKQGISIETVSKVLNIRPSFVEALENNDYSVFPAEVYGVGFLRSYGNYLGLKGDKVIQKYKEQISKKDTDGILPVKAEKDVLPQKKLISISIVLVFVVLVVSLYIGQSDKSKFSTIQTQTTLPEIEIQPPKPEVTAFIETEISISDPNDYATSDNVDAVPEKTLSLEEQIKEKFSNITGTMYGTLSLDAPVILVAKDSVWIEIKDKNKIVFNQTLMPGDAYFVENSEINYILRTGFASALFVYVNGIPKGELSKKETVKSNILLKPETFKKK